MKRARRVIVGGDTDGVWPVALDRVLARRRAPAVRRFPLRPGRVPARTLIARAYGETSRVGSNATELGRQNNRRVVPFVQSGSGTRRI